MCVNDNKVTMLTQTTGAVQSLTCRKEGPALLWNEHSSWMDSHQIHSLSYKHPNQKENVLTQMFTKLPTAS